MTIPVNILRDNPQLILQKISAGSDLAKFFEPGKPIDVIVKQILNNNTAKLEIGNREIIAKTDVPLKANTQITVKNINTYEKPILKIIQPPLPDEQAVLVNNNTIKKTIAELTTHVKQHGRGFPFNKLGTTVARLADALVNADTLTTKHFDPLKPAADNGPQGQKKLVPVKQQTASPADLLLTGGGKKNPAVQTQPAATQPMTKPDISTVISQLKGLTQLLRNTGNPEDISLAKKTEQLVTQLTRMVAEKNTAVFPGKRSDMRFAQPEPPIKEQIINAPKPLPPAQVKQQLREVIQESIQPLKATPKITQTATTILDALALQSKSSDPITGTNLLNTATIHAGQRQSIITEQEAIGHLSKLFNAMTLNPENITVKNLMETIHNSGLIWENKLERLFTSILQGRQVSHKGIKTLITNDMKALALLAEKLLSGQMQSDTLNKLQVFREFSETIEKFQTVNSNTADDSGKYLLPLPFFSNADMKFGELFIDTGGKNQHNNKNKTIKVAFILELSSLGDVMADFAVYNKSITGFFGVSGEKEKQLFEHMLPEFEANIQDLGFTIKKITCTILKKEELNEKTFLESVLNNRESTLNIVI